MAGVAAVETEQGKLYTWQLEVLERLGYPTSQAAELALGRIDLHKLADLIKRGCDRDLALRIL